MAPRAQPGSPVVASALPLPYPDSIVLATAGQQLLDRGCTVELADFGVCGELDVRLLVRRDGGSVSVEVLGPCDGPPEPDRWYAVRSHPDGSPCLWAGPARPCPPEALVAFVEDLLVDDDSQLLREDRYSRYG